MTFLECINRILRLNAIIRGDTDPVMTFADTAHNASLNIAILAVQDELVRLVSRRLIPKERKTSGSISFVTNTRTYDLATDFIRFYGTPHFYNVTKNRQIYEYKGGLTSLQTDIYDYAAQYGDPVWWYWEPVDSANKKVGFHQVPAASENNVAWTYDYEASVMVTVAADPLPFHNDEENFCFTSMCGRRFKYMFEDVKNQVDVQSVLDKDTGYLSSTTGLYQLLKGRNAIDSYGTVYA